MIHTPAPFRVFDASAGAGKTFRLVQEYLALCLRDEKADRYRNILAVTFTNKAAAEMRERVFRMLREMSLSADERPDEANSMLKGISEMTGIAPDILSRRSGRVLKVMLHDYANISISTIDRFTHRLIRTFAHDLNLSTSFDLEMDAGRLMEQAVDLIFSRAGTEEILTDVLLRFTHAQMDEEKSWDLFRSLMEVASELISESSIQDVESLSSIGMERIVEVQRELEYSTRLGVQRLKEIGSEYESMLGRFQLTIDDIKGKRTRAPSLLFQKWKTGEIVDFNESRQPYLDGTGDYFTAKGGPPPAVQDQVREEATRLILEAVEIQRELRWKKELATTLYGLALLGELSKEWEAIKTEENVLPISDFNRILHREIRGVHAPYVFERLGERFRHFFLDEFQDTSVLQWENMWPLVENAISGGGTCMVVGDAKQSIYRWRNGDPEQFIDLSKWEDREDIPFAAETVPMEENRRSRPKIVEFNNRFFEEASSWLNDPDYQQLYRSAHQIPMSSKPGGFVEVRWINGDNVEERIESASILLVEKVRDLISEGHDPGDIAILVRKGKEGSHFATSLAEAGIDVVGSDTLYVRNSKEVRLIYSTMKWGYAPENNTLRFDVLEGLVENRLVDVDQNDPHGFYSKLLHLNHENLIRTLGELIPGWEGWSEESVGLYAQVEHLTRIFGFLNDPNAFVQSFLDQVYSFSQRSGASLATFFDWWERKADGLALDIPESNHAVKVLTLHKSKGLQFPVVIIPFADWSDRGVDALWMDVPQSIPLERAKVRPRSADDDPNLRSAYDQGVQQGRFDNLNLLYVGMTRPKDRLYIFTTPSEANRRGSNTVAANFDFLRPEVDPETGVFTYGELPEPTKKGIGEKPTPSTWYSRDWVDVARISRTAPQDWEERQENPRYWGNLVHRLLEEIQVPEETASVIQHWMEEGRITSSEAQKAQVILQKLFSMDEVVELYRPDVEVLSERDLILPEGRVLRPDRMVRTQKGWVIMDFKTGEVVDKNVKQVDEYAEILEEITGESVKRMLVYLHADGPHEIHSWQ